MELINYKYLIYFSAQIISDRFIIGNKVTGHRIVSTNVTFDERLKKKLWLSLLYFVLQQININKLFNA